VTMGAAGAEHDDLVLAVALACWLATHGEANGAAAWSAYVRRLATPGAAPLPPADARPPLQTARQDAFLGGLPSGMH
jgi:hypothetical protein